MRTALPVVACLAVLPTVGYASVTNLHRLEALGLPSVAVGEVILHYSSNAETVAREYAAEVDAAARWLHAHTEWRGGPVQVAVLTEDDFPKVTRIPYPTPYAEGLSGLLIVADAVDQHPGFELWDIPSEDLNTAWAFHELGHLVARDLGIWSTSAWVNELVANILMAAYVRSERPQFAAYQAGLPQRFHESPGATTLAELDAVYFAMGQLNYLWFHFQIAALADSMVAGADIGLLVDELRRAFPAQDRRPISVADTFRRLELIHPGITAMAGRLAQ